MIDWFIGLWAAVKGAVNPTFFMDGGITVGLVLVVVLLVIAVVVGRKARAYFSNREGLGIARGIVMGPAVILLLALAGAVGLTAVFYVIAPKAHAEGVRVPGTWFNDAGVFLGLDHTKKLSPMCHAGGVDDRTTSNLGAKLNVWQSPSGNVRFNTMYTHHSCALNPDNRSYDALGVQVEWVFWRR